MIIYSDNLPFEYELEKLTRLFFPFEKITFSSAAPDFSNELSAQVRVYSKNGDDLLSVTVSFKGKKISKEQLFEPDKSMDPD